MNNYSSNFSIVAQNSPSVVYGTGLNAVPFFIANSGPSALPGYVLGGTSLWTSSETQLNCTIACRSHGMKYAMMVFGRCGCSPYNPGTIFVNLFNGVPDTALNALTVSACSGYPEQGSTGFLGCFGDSTQLGAGYITTSIRRYTSGPIGLYAAAVFFDNTFAPDGSINYAAMATSYGYLGCFIMTGDSTSFQPQGFSNYFNSMSGCYTFCANLNMPYAGMAFAGGT